MSTYIAFPLCLPTTFYLAASPETAWAETIPDHEEQVYYRQKVQTTDTIQIAFWSNTDAHWTLAAKLIDTCDNNKEVDTFSVATLEQGVTTDYDWNFFEANFSTLDDGIYQIKITAVSDLGDSYTFYSEPYYVRTTWDNTVWLEWANEVNDFDCPYEDMAEAFTWGLRVEGGFESNGYQPSSKDVIYIDQNRVPTMLDSIPYVVKKATFGGAVGLPNYLANIINRAWSHTHTYIDDIRYVKNEGAKLEPSRSDRYPMAGWTLDLMEVDETFSNEITQSVYFVLGYGEIAYQSGNDINEAAFPAKKIIV